MRDKILVLGTGGNALDVCDIVKESYNVLGFLDDAPEKQHFSYRDVNVLGTLERHRDYPEAKLVLAIGSYRNHTDRLGLLERMGLAGTSDRFPIIVHPNVTISPSACLGHGCIVLAGATIGARATLGRFVWCLQNTVVSHDASIGDGTLCACQTTVAGYVSVGQACYLGAGCIIRDGIKIADRSLVGMGAVVTRDIISQGTYAGNPARQIGSVSLLK